VVFVLQIREMMEGLLMRRTCRLWVAAGEPVLPIFVSHPSKYIMHDRSGCSPLAWFPPQAFSGR
jgi:hypothetical protein